MTRVARKAVLISGDLLVSLLQQGARLTSAVLCRDGLPHDARLVGAACTPDSHGLAELRLTFEAESWPDEPLSVLKPAFVDATEATAAPMSASRLVAEALTHLARLDAAQAEDRRTARDGLRRRLVTLASLLGEGIIV